MAGVFELVMSPTVTTESSEPSNSASGPVKSDGLIARVAVFTLCERLPPKAWVAAITTDPTTAAARAVSIIEAPRSAEGWLLRFMAALRSRFFF